MNYSQFERQRMIELSDSGLQKYYMKQQIAQEWIKETLVLMGKPNITVNTQVSHNYLKVTLSARVLEDMRQEETQLKSWGMLAMEAVREKMGKPLRSLRIVLESPR